MVRPSKPSQLPGIRSESVGFLLCSFPKESTEFLSVLPGPLYDPPELVRSVAQFRTRSGSGTSSPTHFEVSGVSDLQTKFAEFGIR